MTEPQASGKPGLEVASGERWPRGATRSGESLSDESLVTGDSVANGRHSPPTRRLGGGRGPGHETTVTELKASG